jgi:hypothetical protein
MNTGQERNQQSKTRLGNWKSRDRGSEMGMMQGGRQPMIEAEDR